MAARMRRHRGGLDDDAVDTHLAMAAAEDAVEVQQQRRLSGPVGSHDGDLLAGRDVEVDAAQRLRAIGVGEVEVLDDDAGRRALVAMRHDSLGVTPGEAPRAVPGSLTSVGPSRNVIDA